MSHNNRDESSLLTKTANAGHKEPHAPAHQISRFHGKNHQFFVVCHTGKIQEYRAGKASKQDTLESDIVWKGEHLRNAVKPTKSELENELGTSDQDQVVDKILREGQIVNVNH